MPDTIVQDGSWIAPHQVFSDGTLRGDMALLVADGQIAEVAQVANLPASARPVSIAGTLTPGFVDLQVNGGGGVLLNQTPTVAGMEAIAAAHRRFGTVAILPTVITDAPGILNEVAEAALAAKGRDGIAGLHIEGPHISTARRGTHAERFVRPLDQDTITIVARLREAGIPVMITVAPENVTEAQIAALAATGAVVSLGHSDASAETTRASLAAGASCFTHLFNAMSPIINRAPGMTGAAINSAAYAGIICDGIHVADELVGLAIRGRPEPDRTFLVSDAMPTVGGPAEFDLYGNRLHLRDGRLLNDEGSLAGAHVTMAESVARLVNTVGVDAQTALRMAITVPCDLMGLPDLATVHGRSLADLLILDDQMQVRATLKSSAPAAA